MGETTNSSEDSSPKNVRLNRSAEKSCRSATKNENRVTNGLPKTVTSSLKGRQTDIIKGSPLRETVNKNDTATSDASPVIKSRYGRTHKPKIPEDFLPTDKKVAAILGHSPQKSPGKSHNSPTSSPSEVAKVTAKGRKLYDIFTRREKTSDGACGSVNSPERNRKSEAESNHKRNDNLEKKAESVVINGMTQVKIKEEITETSVQRNESFPACDWRVGDLAWARVSGYPFWPCMIALDPEKGIFTRVISRGNFTMLHLHVQFFGDNGRRSWLYSNCVIPFEGLEALNRLSTKLQAEVKKLDKKLASAFTVTPKAKVKWDIAVEEAEVSLRRTREERIQEFATRFPYNIPKKNKKSEVNITPRKQKQLTANENEFKKTSSEQGSPKSKGASPESVKKKYQRKKYNAPEKLTGDFKVYLAKYLDRMSEEHPKLSKKDIGKYLAKEWQEMDQQERAKYHLRVSSKNAGIDVTDLLDEIEDTDDDDNDSNESEEEERDDDGEEEEDRESNDSGKTSSTETRELSPVPHSKLRKGGGLFRGTKQEKVCQVCEKPGDTVKCKGPCCGSFHLSCISETEPVEEEISDIIIDVETVEPSIEEVSDTVLNDVGKKRKRQDSGEDNGTEIFMSKKKEKLDDSLCVKVECDGNLENDDKDSTEDKVFEVPDEIIDKETNKASVCETSNKEIDQSGITNIDDQITNEERMKENSENKEIGRENVEDKESGIEESEEFENDKGKPEGDGTGKESTDDKESGIEELEDNESDKEKNEDGENGKVIIQDGEKVDFNDIDEVGNDSLERMDCSDDKGEDSADFHSTKDVEITAAENKVEGSDVKEINEESSSESETKMDFIENAMNDESLKENLRKDDENKEILSKTPRLLSEKRGEIQDTTESPRRLSRKREVRDISESPRRLSRKRKESGDISESPRRLSRRREESGCLLESPRRLSLRRNENRDESPGFSRRVSRKREQNENESPRHASRKSLENGRLTTDVKKKEKETGDKKTSGKKKEKEEKKDEDSSEFRCWDCRRGINPPCFACGKKVDLKTGTELRHRCAVGYCGKFYHPECLKLWPHAWSNGGSTSRRQTASAGRGHDMTITCPQHVCHTCASDDPRNTSTRYNHERLVRCIRCPTAYHSGNYCLPAGSEVLTGSQIICPKHYIPPPKKAYHVNAAWCFICAMGGSLICCDLCPTSFHAECLHISAPEGSFICEDCDTGRFPLYGEIVWVKLGAYRWWPAQILFPNQIPDNILNLPHVLGEFAVRFFGSHDHYWVNRGRVFLYQEGDTGHNASRKSYMEGVFCRALQEASEAHATLKGEKATRDAEARPVMKPPMYVKIKTNKPVGDVRVTEMDPACMTPCECDTKSDNPCGPESDCLNRILLVECNPSVCPAGERCGNQCFEKRQYPPLVPYRTESRGWGLKTLADIHKGDFVIEYVGEMIDEAEYQYRMTRKHEEKDENYYFLTIDKDRMLDAGPKGNVARFMNHSCQPNCETQKWTVNGDTRVGLFSLEDISAGTELTFNYNLECVGPDKKPCMCGAPNCSGFIGMKANKAEEDRKPRADQQTLTKRRKKRRNGLKLSDDLCFICGKGGELVICYNKTCPKGYHLSCLHLTKFPDGKWHCPWHRCNECNKRTIKRCGYCPNSFCPCHSDGKIRLHPSLGLVCQKHDTKSNLDVKQEPMEVLDTEAKPESEDVCSNPAPGNPSSSETVKEEPVVQKRKRGRPRNSSVDQKPTQSISSSKLSRRHSEPVNGLTESLLDDTTENTSNLSCSIELDKMCNEQSDLKGVFELSIDS